MGAASQAPRQRMQQRMEKRGMNNKEVATPGTQPDTSARAWYAALQALAHTTALATVLGRWQGTETRTY